MTIQKCTACHRQASFDRYCLHHTKALESLNKHYKSWVDAYTNISRHDFLSNLSGMRETGSWVKEVIAIEFKE